MFATLKNNRRVWYELLGGQTDPVVCLNHSLTADSGMWAEQVPALLKEKYQVLRLDIRGHGASDPVRGPYTMHDLAADVKDVLNILAIDKVHLVGLSIGGMFGQAFAVDYPEKLLSLTLCDTMPESAANATSIWDERINIAKKELSLAPMAAATLERWLTPKFRSQNLIRTNQILESIVRTSVDGFVGCAQAVRNFSFVDQLPSVEIPALVICGSDDPGTPPSENKRLASLLKNGKYFEVPECRHLPNIEKPLEFNEILIHWLSSNR